MGHAGENSLSLLQAHWARLQGLDPQVVAVTTGLSVGVIVVSGLLMWLMRRGLCRLLQLTPDVSKRERQAQIRKFLGLTIKGLTFLIAVTALFVIGRLWGFDVLGWTRSALGSRVAATSLALVVILLVAGIALEAASLATHFSVERLKARAADDPRRVAQLDTLGPIFRSALQISIAGVAVMTVLSQVGVQIAPILAGAGVAGIAIGFGAQTLVKDFFTGFFLIIEDIVAVGDVVQIQGFSGTVEQMTLRTIRLRDFDGTLHVLPYGESQIIHNMTKTFSYAAFDSWVRADTDLTKAIAIMREAFDDLKADKSVGPLMIGGLEIAGVDAMTDLGILIKGRIRTLPQERWRVLRAFSQRLKSGYDGAGITLGHKV